MIPRLALAFCLLALLPARGGWQEELTEGPGDFAALRPFRAHYKFGWAAFSAADAEIEFTRKKGGLAQLKATTRTFGVVRTMWRMDAEHLALMQAATLRPISMRQTETYSRKTLTTKLDFTPEGVARLRQSNLAGDQPGKTKQFEFPQTYDLHSAFHFIRSQPLQIGDSCKLVVYPTTSPYLAQVTVTARQRMRIGAQTYPALKVDLKLWRISDKLVLEKHDKFKRATAWLSDDENRLLLRLESDLFVGSVWGEMDKVELR